jgi:beta-lactamase regulating signal transducer with metallopeptidase domain
MSPSLDSLVAGVGGPFLASLALSGTLLAVLGLLVARGLTRCPAPLPHAILKATVLLLLLSPLLVALNLRCGLGLIRLPHRLAAQDRAQPPRLLFAFTITAGSGDASLAPAEPSDTAPARWPAAEWLPDILVIVWGLGAAWQAVLLGRGLWLVRRLRRSVRAPRDPRWAYLAVKAARYLGLRRAIQVGVSDLARAPVSLGMARPLIVVPAVLESALDDEDILGILLHESAHVARRDQLAGFLQRLVRVVFWWQPLVGILCRYLDEVQEELCDNSVIEAQGSGVPFARCLVKLAEWALGMRELPAVAGLLGRRRGLEHRVVRLLTQEGGTPTHRTGRVGLYLLPFVLAAGGLVAAVTVKAEPAKAAVVPTAAKTAEPEKPVRRAGKTPAETRSKERESPKSPRSVGAAKPRPSGALQRMVFKGTLQFRTRSGKVVVIPVKFVLQRPRGQKGKR